MYVCNAIIMRRGFVEKAALSQASFVGEHELQCPYCPILAAMVNMTNYVTNIRTCGRCVGPCYLLVGATGRICTDSSHDTNEFSNDF